ITDIKMPGMSGLELLEAVKSKPGVDPDLPVVMLTSIDSVETAVQAMRLGAVDYLTKPSSPEEVDFKIQKALNFPILSAENRMVKSQRTETCHFEGMVGTSLAMQDIYDMVERIADTETTILITGETGTGKELIARAIHDNGPRSDKRLYALHCAAIPEELLESELFGHEKGAFTGAVNQKIGVFEAADGGTLFLDEIGEMSLAAQVRLLRVLDAKEVTRLGSTQPLSVDVRVIAATNKDLQQAVATGHFRQDLYQRLRVVEIDVPPLRSRPEDILLLIEHFVKLHSIELNMPPIAFDEEALTLLKRYRWPGNARELKNLINRLMVLSPVRQISASILTEHLKSVASPPEYNKQLPVHLGKTPAESDRDLLYWAILEVARDIKELKAKYFNNNGWVKKN
ncbi:MAG: sigma-54-dependent Fis family transcriptional regulator, partial [Leptospiraceae bacterium]|nr:sigma-54-dependent Fis family transcriptional regulator [Leptospiraceae bacterium]